MKIALCLIVKATDSEAELLARCLGSVAAHVDGIFITITGENQKCEDVCKAFNANISHFTWVNDFSKARNFNFSQVPKEYDFILWLDADDVIRGVEKLKATIEANPSDCYSMYYLYAFDEFKQCTVSHLKTRVVKNDGCVEWAGSLHEDFKENRALNRFLIEGIEVLHLTDASRVEVAKGRNLAISEAEVAEHGDDPRSWWNLGNSLIGAQKWEEALSALQKFQELSQSDEEKFVARLRMAEACIAVGRMKDALTQSQMAIGLRPKYPDGYHMAGHILLSMGRLTEARDMIQQGLVCKPPYNNIVVFNPRQYDFIPLMTLAKIYVQLHFPNLALTCLKACKEIYPTDTSLDKIISDVSAEAKKFEEAVRTIERLREIKDKEELKRELEGLSNDIKSHPAICALRNAHFVKETSSGRDLVYYCGLTEEPWTPETAKTKGIGGSEEAVIHLTKRFAKAGWNVTVYNNCGSQEQEFEGVKFKPFWMWNPRDKQDVTILWRTPRGADYHINTSKLFIDLHDVVQEGEFNEKRLQVIDKIFVKSKAHRALFQRVPDEKFAILPNGIVWEQLQGDKVKRDPFLLLNTSSPDRSINTLLDLFAEVKKEVPQARLEWAYGWGVFDIVNKDDKNAMDWKASIEKKLKETPGVTVLGRLGHDKIAEKYQEAAVFAYPTAFYEIDCISARKAQAAGAIPVATDFAALNETVKYGVKVKTDVEKENWGKPYAMDFGLKDPEARKKWVEACVMTLRANYDKEWRNRMRNDMRRFDWDTIASEWELLLSAKR